MPDARGKELFNRAVVQQEEPRKPPAVSFFNQSPKTMPDQTNKSAQNTNQGNQSERERQNASDQDLYKRSVTGNDASKQDENFIGTDKTPGASLDERDTNDGDANSENN
jgi:hypothetical protein